MVVGFADRQVRVEENRKRIRRRVLFEIKRYFLRIITNKMFKKGGFEIDNFELNSV